MKVRALRGVCVGVERHLALDEVADLDPAQVNFLVSIGAVERLPEVPTVNDEPAAEGGAASDASATEPTTPAKPGKKEK